MISVSDNIKQAYDQSTIQVDKIVLDGQEYRITNVEYFDDCYDEGNIFGTAIARQLQFDIENTVNLEKKEIQYYTGIYVNNVIQWINLGNFIIQDVEPNDTTNINTVSAMDYMLKTNIKYQTTLNYANNTVTISDVLYEACYNSGIDCATLVFPNSTFIVDSNQFEVGTLNREVIQAVAQISGTVAKIKSDNRLYLISPNNQENRKTFTLNNYKEAEIKRNTNPINVVSLGMQDIEGENVVLRDETSIAQNGENALIINNNPFAYTQTKRGQLITALFNAVKGFEYKAYAFECQGLPYLETMDKIKFKDKEGNEYDSFIFRFNYKSPKGLESTIEAPSIIKATVNYQNVLDSIDIARRTEILVDKQNQTIESVVENVTTQNNKIARVEQTVDEINSKISDIADITTSQETLTGSLTFENINASEPVHIEIHPIENISYLYPFNTLYPANDLYIKLRTLRFTNTDTDEIFDYELPDDLLIYDSDNYDEFILDYDSQTVYINKKCKYNTNTGAVELLSEEIINEYPFPSIELTDGDYTVQMLKYDNTPYNCYLFVRLMSQNIYTEQFYTKSETNSKINQKADEIILGVNQTFTNYSTTNQMNSAINLKANEITSSVSSTYETKAVAQANYTRLVQRSNEITLEVSEKVGNDEVISRINQSAEAITINANRINLSRKGN